MMAWAQRLSPDAKVFAGALVAIVIVSFITVALESVPRMPAVSVRSDQRGGAMALRLWLEASGYQARELSASPLPLREFDVLFVFSPLSAHNQAEALRIRDWVRGGGVLVAAGSPRDVNMLLQPYSINLAQFPYYAGPVTAAAPTLLHPPVDRVSFGVAYSVESDRDDAVTHFYSRAEGLVVSLNEGAGRVWAVGGVRPFTNLGLREEGSAALVLNMLDGIPPGAVIGFDEALHDTGGAAPSLFDWLVGTSPGWGVLSALGLTMAFLGLRGRRFGRALPLPDDRLRREPVEYIQAMASLFRRSGQRAMIAGHYRQRLRRHLVERYGVDARLTDADLMRALAFYEPGLDEQALTNLLLRLKKQDIGEAELVHLAQEVDNWLRRLN